MYDINSIESGEKEHENIATNYYQTNNSYTNIPSSSPLSALSLSTSSTHTIPSLSSSSLSSSSSSPLTSSNLTSSASLETAFTISTNNKNMFLRRRRIFQRQACLLSVMAAFSIGLALGVFIPMIGMSAAFTSSDLFFERSNKTIEINHQIISSNADANTYNNREQQKEQIEQNQGSQSNHPSSNFPNIYEIRSNNDYNDRNSHHTSPQVATDMYSVSFIKDKELPAEEVFRNAFHLEQDKNSEDTLIVKKLDANDGSIKEFRVQRISDGMFRKGPEKLLSKPSINERILSKSKGFDDVKFVPIKSQITSKMQYHFQGVIKDSIYWGDLIEKSLPQGYSNQDAEHWNTYVRNGVITHLETGCGRMQNRMVIFNDGTRACARYRQNTDQIQGELFSFYLGQLLNLTNLAPSTASVIDLETETWTNAVQDITLAQWKSFRPVVLTKWLPNLEPAGIPTPFQPLERHLNKFDVWNITLGIDHEFKMQQQQKGLLDRLGAGFNDDQSKRSADTYNILSGTINAADDTVINVQDIKISGINDKNNDVSDDIPHNADNEYNHKQQHSNDGYNENNHEKDQLINSTILNRLVELAQWSDLIVFDYLIANLDRVVNNLYNYQWNADIMAAPAHNLARQTNSQLLVFLDNESGLLHGYRLLKKYEAYHGLLLDNLCVFRQPTILALQSLRDYGVGHQLQQIFERSTSHQVRDVLPSLPDKSIKILIDRIDRVLGQVHKCRDLFSDR